MVIWLIIVGIGIFLLIYSLNKQNKEFANNKNIKQKPTMSTEFMNFKEEQKAAIIGTLIVVAKCDGQLHPKEMDALTQTIKVMGFDSTSPYMAKMQQGGLDYMLPILKSLDKTQKDWFIVTMHSLMHADGHVAEKEVAYCLGIAEQMGISQNEYKSILDKMDGLFNTFFK